MDISIKFTVQFDTLVSSRIDLTNNIVTYFNEMWRKTQTKTRHFCSLLLLSLLVLLLLLNTPLPISIACNEPMKQLRCKLIYLVLFRGGVLVSRLFIYLSIQCLPIS